MSSEHHSSLDWIFRFLPLKEIKGKGDLTFYHQEIALSKKILFEEMEQLKNKWAMLIPNDPYIPNLIINRNTKKNTQKLVWIINGHKIQKNLSTEVIEQLPILQRTIMQNYVTNHKSNFIQFEIERNRLNANEAILNYSLSTINRNIVKL